MSDGKTNPAPKKKGRIFRACRRAVDRVFLFLIEGAQNNRVFIGSLELGELRLSSPSAQKNPLLSADVSPNARVVPIPSHVRQACIFRGKCRTSKDKENCSARIEGLPSLLNASRICRRFFASVKRRRTPHSPRDWARFRLYGNYGRYG